MTCAQRGPRQPAWRAEEDAALRAGLAAGKTLPQITEDMRQAGFRRSGAAVTARARVMAQDERDMVAGAKTACPKTVRANPAERVEWAPAHEEIVRAGYEQGHAAGQIARALCDAGREGTTRNAVLGKINRLVRAGAVARRGASGAMLDRIFDRARAAAERQAAGEAATVAAAARAPAQSPPPKPRRRREPVGILLAEVEGAACRWPVGPGEGIALRVCGGAPLSGRPYCAAHMARAYAPGTARPVLAPREGRSVRPEARAREDRPADLVDAIGGGA